MKLSAPNHRFLKEVQRLCGVKLTLDHVNSGHRRLYLPDGRFVVASLTGSRHMVQNAARAVRQLLEGEAA